MEENLTITSMPKPDVRDYARAIVTGILNGAVASVPLPGIAVAAELLSIILTPPVSRRQDNWMVSIAVKLVELQNKVDSFRIDDLSANEAFVTVLLQATQSALRNHQEERLEALRNAVLNSALPSAPEDDLQLIFLNLVDVLTPWHLRMLKLFDNPVRWMEENGRPFPKNIEMGGVQQVIEHALPELNRMSDLVVKIKQDLSTQGLAEIPSGMMTKSGLLDSRTTNLGRQFIQFVSTPIPLRS